MSDERRIHWPWPDATPPETVLVWRAEPGWEQQYVPASRLAEVEQERDRLRAKLALAHYSEEQARGPADDTHPCDDCGDTYFERMGSYWLAPGKLWRAVVGDDTIVLCPGCFATRAREQGQLIYWRAVSRRRDRG